MQDALKTTRGIPATMPNGDGPAMVWPTTQNGMPMLATALKRESEHPT